MLSMDRSVADAVLTLNAGSSRIKFALFTLSGVHRLELASPGVVEGIGSAPRFVVRSRDAELDFQSLLEVVINWVEVDTPGFA